VLTDNFLRSFVFNNLYLLSKGRRLQEILEMPVELRPVDLYAACAEVAR
jgi:hypothetical protein